MAVKRSSLSRRCSATCPTPRRPATCSRTSTSSAPADLLLENAFNAADVVSTVRLKGDKGEVVLNKTSAGTWQFEKPAGFGDADVEGDMAAAGTDAAAERASSRC